MACMNPRRRGVWLSLYRAPSPLCAATPDAPAFPSSWLARPLSIRPCRTWAFLAPGRWWCRRSPCTPPPLAFVAGWPLRTGRACLGIRRSPSAAVTRTATGTAGGPCGPTRTAAGPECADASLQLPRTAVGCRLRALRPEPAYPAALACTVCCRRVATPRELCIDSVRAPCPFRQPRDCLASVAAMGTCAWRCPQQRVSATERTRARMCVHRNRLHACSLVRIVPAGARCRASRWHVSSRQPGHHPSAPTPLPNGWPPE